MSGCPDVRKGGGMNGWVHIWMCGQYNDWMDGRKNGLMDGWMDE